MTSPHRRRGTAAVTLAALAWLTPFSSASQIAYLNPDNPSWNLPSNWSSNALPQPGDDVLIDAIPDVRGVVHLNIDSTISTLRILPGKHLLMQNGFSLTLLGSSLENQGRITVQSTGTPTSILLGGNELLLSGGGSVSMQSSAQIGGGGRLVNLDNRFLGTGQIGLNTIGIENGKNGIIEARPGASSGLVLDPSPAAGLVNRGLLLASSSGNLRLSGNGGGSFNNLSGIIRAQDSAVVFLREGAAVNGGTLTTSGSGVIRIPQGQSASLADLTAAGRLVVDSQGLLTLSGTITNTGSISVAGTLGVDSGGTATLTGGGRVLLEGGMLRGRLINSDNLIEGSGLIGIFGFPIVNHGIIRSTPGTGISIFSSTAQPFVNTGTIQASGAILRLSGQFGRDFLNDGGRIEAMPGTMIELERGATIIDGEIGGISGGRVQLQPQENATIRDLSVIGQVDVGHNSILTLRGQIHNSGGIGLTGISGVSSLNVEGTVNLTGSGVVAMYGQSRLTGSGTLINVGNQIRGEGSLGNNAVVVVNESGGILHANRSGGSLVIDPPPGGFLQNRGTLRADANATLILTGAGGGTFDSAAGSVEINAGTLLTADGAELTAGPITNSGTFAHQSGSATVGTINGTGTLSVGENATLSATRIRQNRLTIEAGGSATIRAGGPQAPASRLTQLQIAGGSGNWLGVLDLDDNALVVDYTGASPIEVIRHQIESGFAGGAWTGNGITSAAARGHLTGDPPTAVGYAPSTAIFATFPAGFRGVSVDSTSVLVAHTLAGDANLDGVVNLADFNRLAANFGATNAVWSMGDFNYDGLVNLADFNRLAANFGLQAGPDGPTPDDWAALAAAVPEPTSLTLLGVAALSTMLRRRRR